MTKVINAAVIAYGVIIATLGAQAYFMPRPGHPAHFMSLAGGATIGVLMIVSYFIWQTKPRFGRIMSLVLAVGSLGMFAPRLISTGALYPNGLMVVLSIILIGLLGSGHMMANKDKGTGAAR
jgi:hypothetical protein